MKPQISTYELILSAAKNAAANNIAARDANNQFGLGEVKVRFVERLQQPWLLFEVIFGYFVNDPKLEKSDDLQILIPWNSENNQLGQIEIKVF